MLLWIPTMTSLRSWGKNTNKKDIPSHLFKGYQVALKELISKCYHRTWKHPEMRTQLDLSWYTVMARFFAVMSDRTALVKLTAFSIWFLLKTSIKSNRHSNISKVHENHKHSKFSETFALKPLPILWSRRIMEVCRHVML